MSESTLAMEKHRKMKYKHSQILRRKSLSQHLQFVTHEGGTIVYDGWDRCLGNFATETEAWEAMQMRFKGI